MHNYVQKTWPMKWRSRHRLGVLRRLEIIGCIKEVTARAFQEGRLKDRRYRCLKMVREPTEADWKAFLDTPYHGLDNVEVQRRAQQARQDDDQDGDEADADITGYADRGDENPEEEIQEVERSIPQWTPERPINNFIFDLVHEAGEQGISTKVNIAFPTDVSLYRSQQRRIYRAADSEIPGRNRLNNG